MDTIDLLKKHVSVRDFQDEPLSADTKHELIEAAHSASSSQFVQATSIIDVQETTNRSEIGKISLCEPFIVHSGAFFIFVADLYRQAKILERHDESLDSVSNMEALMVAIVDTAIEAQNMAVAAESKGLGICYIGGIRNDIRRVAKLLRLPKYTVPLVGMTIGIPKHKNGLKPRLLQKNMAFVDHYDTAASADLTTYDKMMTRYYNERNSNHQATDWSTKMARLLSSPRRPDVEDFLKDQGFKI